MTHAFLPRHIEGTQRVFDAIDLLRHRAPGRVGLVTGVGIGIVRPRGGVVAQIYVPGEKAKAAAAAAFHRDEICRDRHRRPELPFHAHGGLHAVRLMVICNAKGVEDATLRP